MAKAKKVTLTEDAKAARRAYHNAWYAKNKDKAKQYQANFWARKAADIEVGDKDGTISQRG